MDRFRVEILDRVRVSLMLWIGLGLRMYRLWLS